MPWPKTGATQYHAKLGLPDYQMVDCLQWLAAYNGLALAVIAGPLRYESYVKHLLRVVKTNKHFFDFLDQVHFPV